MRRGRYLRALLRWPVGLGALIAIGVGLGAVAVRLRGPDTRLVVAVVGWRTPGLTTTAHLLSYLGRSWVALVLAAGVDLIARHRRLRAGRALLGVLGAVIVQNVVKLIVMRPRPAVVHLEHVTSSSFPSGHATQATALLAGAVLAVWDAADARGPRVMAALCGALLAGAVGLARVYLGVHYLSDVVAGTLLGLGCATLAAGTLRHARRST